VVRGTPAIEVLPFSIYHSKNMKQMHKPAFDSIYGKFPTKRASPQPSKLAQDAVSKDDVSAKLAAVGVVGALLPFKRYYTSHMKTVKQSALEQIYGMFPARR
jgi:hypothetical protein